jgi:hypothetical protein
MNNESVFILHNIVCKRGCVKDFLFFFDEPFTIGASGGIRGEAAG